jgi:hypothetical protein
MIYPLSFIAANDADFQSGLNAVKTGTLLVGLAFLVIGASLLFVKPKGEAPHPNATKLAFRIVGVLLIAAGVVIPYLFWPTR